MNVSVAEVMSDRVIAVRENAEFAEIVDAIRRLPISSLPVIDSNRHRIHQLPVVDQGSGRLVGIVTRSDLLAVYERPDEDIRREVRYDVIQDELGMDPDRFGVSVEHGTVTLSGEVDHRLTIRALIEAVRHVEGVVDVTERLTCRQDTASHTDT